MTGNQEDKNNKMNSNQPTPQNSSVDKRTTKGYYFFLGSMIFIHASFIYFFTLLFIALYYQIWWLLTILVLIYSYQLSEFCTKQQWFVDLIQVEEQYKYFRDWSCVKEAPLGKSHCLIAAHPHGILNYGFIMNGGSAYTDFIIGSSRMMLILPMNGLFLKWCGVQGVNPQNMKHQMKNGKNMALLPGGFEEATITSKQECRVFIKNRKGFIKYAIQYGYEVFPMFVFGENKLYNVFEPLLQQRLMLNKFKMPGVVFWSKRGILPDDNQGLNAVIGKPLKFEKQDNPSQEQIDKCHQQYIEALVDLFNRNKDKYNEKSNLAIY